MYDYILGFITGFCWVLIFNELKNWYRNKKLKDSQKKLEKTILNFNKKFEPDPINIDFQCRKQEIAYNNKLKQVEAKIKHLKCSKLPKELAEMMTGSIIVQLADSMVEADRISGRLDDLYSEIKTNE